MAVGGLRWAGPAPPVPLGRGRTEADGVEGAEEGGGGAAGFDGVGGVFEDGLEGLDDDVAVEVGLVGAVGVDVGRDVGAGEPLEKAEEVFGAGLFGEKVEVFVGLEIGRQEGLVLGRQGGKRGCIYGIHLVPYLYHT